MNKITEIVLNANRLSEVGYVLPQKKYYNRKGKRPGVCKYHIFQYVENGITKNIYIRKDDLAEVKKLVRDKKREFKKLNKESENLLNLCRQFHEDNLARLYLISCRTYES